MKIINIIALTLLVVGGLNWGLIAVANLDLVATLFGVGTTVSKVVYGLVGLSAVYSIFLFAKCKSVCNA